MTDFGLLNSLFRRGKKKTFVVNEPDPVYNVVYLGNVLTIMAKGDGCYDKPLALIWKTYCSRSRPDLPMTLSVTKSGLKAQTKQQGLTEYWSHRITFCGAPAAYPSVFVWIYKHEGKRMKPELRCHAAFCRKPEQPQQITQCLQARIVAALKDYRRDKINRQNLRLAGTVAGHPILPRRKAILAANAGANFRPPMNRSKSAPKLHSIEEAADEYELNDEVAEEADSFDGSDAHQMLMLLEEEEEEEEDSTSRDGSIASGSSAESGSGGSDGCTSLPMTKLPSLILKGDYLRQNSISESDYSPTLIPGTPMDEEFGVFDSDSVCLDGFPMPGASPSSVPRTSGVANYGSLTSRRASPFRRAGSNRNIEFIRPYQRSSSINGCIGLDAYAKASQKSIGAEEHSAKETVCMLDALQLSSAVLDSEKLSDREDANGVSPSPDHRLCKCGSCPDVEELESDALSEESGYHEDSVGRSKPKSRQCEGVEVNSCGSSSSSPSANDSESSCCASPHLPVAKLTNENEEQSKHNSKGAKTLALKHNYVVQQLTKEIASAHSDTDQKDDVLIKSASAQGNTRESTNRLSCDISHF